MEPVLVAGVGDGGLAAAMGLVRRLDRPVVAVDPDGIMWLKSRYHRALEAGSLDPVTLDAAGALRDRGVTVREDRLEGLDPADRVARFSSGELRYAALVVAVGAATRAPPASGDRVLAFREDLPALLEDLEWGRISSITVAGGGTTGLHASAALAGDAGLDDVTLVHGGDRILPSVPPRAAASARERLEELGVEVRTGTRVTGLSGRMVELSEGSLEADRLLWCGGIQPRPLLDELGLPADGDGLVVDEALRCRADRLYAVGDVASYGGKVDDAYHAFHEGRRAARNVARELAGKDPRPFRLRVHPRTLYLGEDQAGIPLRGRLWRGRVPNRVRRHLVEDAYFHVLRWVW